MSKIPAHDTLSAKPTVALGLQLQVQVSDGASVMFQTHVDRDDAIERNKTIDTVHAAAERFLFRYRITALESMITQRGAAIEQEHAQRVRDLENFAKDNARRAVEKDAAMADDARAWRESGKRGDYKPAPRVLTQVARLDQEIRDAQDLETHQKATHETNVAKLSRDIEMMKAEIKDLRAKLAPPDAA
jgi:hypothetical protein